MQIIGRTASDLNRINGKRNRCLRAAHRDDYMGPSPGRQVSSGVPAADAVQGLSVSRRQGLPGLRPAYCPLTLLPLPAWVRGGFIC